MSFPMTYDWRNKRNQTLGNIPQNFINMHYSMRNYSETIQDKVEKSELNEIFGSDIYLNQLNMLSNPLQKNLADTLTQTETKISLNTAATYDCKETSEIGAVMDCKEKQTTNDTRREFYPSLSGIGSFISGVFSVITGAMPFQKRAKSYEDDRDASPPLDSWRGAREQNNCNNQSILSSCENNVDAEVCVMNVDYRSAVAQCEDKIAKVRSILESKTPPISVTRVSSRPRRPKRVFVAPSDVEEIFEDAFCPEECVRLPNDDTVEYSTPCHNVIDSELTEVFGPDYQIMVDKDVKKQLKVDNSSENTAVESTNDTAVINVEKTDDKQDNKGSDSTQVDNDLKTQIITSCEDKVTKLKALLLERRKNNSKISNSNDSVKESTTEHEKTPKTLKIHCHRYKNPNRLTEKRKKCNLRKSIQDDMTFANEIDSDINEASPSAENSPKITKTPAKTENPSKPEPKVDNLECYFDEVSGRFHKSSTSTDSDESFQIVFTDSPQNSPRNRKISDCDSEDSFIVFEDSPDSCYTSTDVFGDDIDTEDDNYDTDSDSGNENGNLAINQAFSRTVSDLTDASLYEEGGLNSAMVDSEDEIDSAVNICEEIPSALVGDTDVTPISAAPKKTGLLKDSKTKKDQPSKKVRFSEQKPKVHVMRVWAFAAKQARVGHWSRLAVDRDRFQKRIADVDVAISWVLKPQHRNRIKFQRFMPWWHAQRRQEIAEKKEQERIAKIAEEEARKKAKEAEDEQVRLALEEDERLLAEEEAFVAAEEAKIEAIKQLKKARKKRMPVKVHKIPDYVDYISMIQSDSLAGRKKNDVSSPASSIDDDNKSIVNDVDKCNSNSKLQVDNFEPATSQINMKVNNTVAENSVTDLNRKIVVDEDLDSLNAAINKIALVSEEIAKGYVLPDLALVESDVAKNAILEKAQIGTAKCEGELFCG